jgi:hypothetical protein
VGHHAVQEMMEILGYRKVCFRCVLRLLTGTEEHKTAGNCSPIHPTVRIWPPQTPLVRALGRTPWRGQHYERQSRKPCEAGSEERERTSTAEASLRFCSASRNI